MFVHLSFFITFFFFLWLNYAVVWCVTPILRFLLQFVTLLQVPAIITWFLFIRGGCVYLSLLRESMVSTLDLSPLMSQGWLWSSWSFFITVSLLSVQHLNTLTSLDCAFFFKFSLGTGVIFWAQLDWTRTAGDVTISSCPTWPPGSCTIQDAGSVPLLSAAWCMKVAPDEGWIWLGLTDKCAVMIPESPSVFSCSPCCKNRKWE